MKHKGHFEKEYLKYFYHYAESKVHLIKMFTSEYSQTWNRIINLIIFRRVSKQYKKCHSFWLGLKDNTNNMNEGNLLQN